MTSKRQRNSQKKLAAQMRRSLKNKKVKKPKKVTPLTDKEIHKALLAKVYKELKGGATSVTFSSVSSDKIFHKAIKESQDKNPNLGTDLKSILLK
jgi:hypothetical protein